MLHARSGLPKWVQCPSRDPSTKMLTCPPKITNPQLRERMTNFGAGLSRVAGIVPQESNVLLLLNDGIGMSP